MDTNVGVDAIIPVGTGGMTGVAQARSLDAPAGNLFAVEPVAPCCPAASPGRTRSGIGAGFVPEVLNTEASRGDQVTNEESRHRAPSRSDRGHSRRYPPALLVAGLRVAKRPNLPASGSCNHPRLPAYAHGTV